MMHAALTVVVWDHLITFCDEVKYVWKKEKSWGTFRQIASQSEILTNCIAFWLFIVVRSRRIFGFEWLLNTLQSRYSVLLCKTWLTISAALFHTGYGSGEFTDMFTASFWTGYTQEVRVFPFSPPWTLSDDLVAQV